MLVEIQRTASNACKCETIERPRHLRGLQDMQWHTLHQRSHPEIVIWNRFATIAGVKKREIKPVGITIIVADEQIVVQRILNAPFGENGLSGSI